MSLVAYASSEEEEEEEEEESDSAEEEEAEEEQGGGGSDGEEEPGAGAGAEGPARGLFSALPPPKAVPGLSRLPPPPQTAFPPGPSSPPAVEPSPPSRPRKRRQPVRIAAPQLLLLHAGESDSEEDEPAKKHPASQGHSEGAGLSALLPQPKNLTVKEANRPLLPYVFTRKVAENAAGPKGPSSTSSASLKMPPLQPGSAAAVLTTPSPSAIKAAAKSAALQVTKQITQEENDSDEEVAPENYFSLPERSEPPALTPPAYVFPGPPTVPDDLPPGTEPEGQEEAGANAPLEFKTGAHPASHSWAPKPAEDHGNRPYAPYPAYSDAGGPAAYYQQDYYSSGYYQQTGPTLGPLQEVSPAADTASSSSSSFFMDDEAFKRLQGKRNRGREEVNFVEIKGDDQLSGAQQWLTKSLTEEQNRKSFSKKKGEQPTGQQRRKHQITYLIHQAKERELELKNTWAENKLSRRQTQAKYGF